MLLLCEIYTDEILTVINYAAPPSLCILIAQYHIYAA